MCPLEISVTVCNYVVNERIVTIETRRLTTNFLIGPRLSLLLFPSLKLVSLVHNLQCSLYYQSSLMFVISMMEHFASMLQIRLIYDKNTTSKFLIIGFGIESD